MVIQEIQDGRLRVTSFGWTKTRRWVCGQEPHEPKGCLEGIHRVLFGGAGASVCKVILFFSPIEYSLESEHEFLPNVIGILSRGNLPRIVVRWTK